MFVTRYRRLKRVIIFCLLLVVGTGNFVHKAYAAYDRFATGDTATLGEFVYEDDFSASTADCTITIYNPSNTAVVSDAAMAETSSGWHYYSYTIPSNGTEGVWPALMSCGTALDGDLVKIDKTFSVGTTVAATSTIATAVWSNTSRTLSSLGTLVSDIWSNTVRTLTGSSLSSGSLATQTDVSTATSSLAAAITTASSSLAAVIAAGNATINANIQSASSSITAEIVTTRALIAALNNISATDVWAAGTRTLTDYATSTVASSTAAAVWDRAAAQLTSTGSIGKRLADNIDATISSRGTSSLTASDIWNAGTRTLSDYNTSAIAAAANTAVWANATRTLTNYGNDITAAQVWDVLTSSLTSVNSVGKLLTDNLDTTVSSRASLTNQTASWNIIMSDQSAIQAGNTYRAKVTILNSNSVPTTPFATPTITLYDAERNTVVSGVSMTALATGVYEYTYSVASSASQGVWETVVSTEVENGKTLTNNDYWIVAGSPAQVIINSVSGTTPDATANVTITNEGLAGYEYQYEWCVVSSASNACGGGDDVYHGTGAKFINPGEDWNTNLTATVPTAGDYYFKLVVYFGTERSGSSRTFSLTAGSTGNTGNTGGSGGGGGGGGGGSSPAPTPTTPGTCAGADFNHDHHVNSVDFSILLSYWKTLAPFANSCVDINHDRVVNSIDFSVLLSQWGTAGHGI